MKINLTRFAMAMIALVLFWSTKPASAENIIRQTVLETGGDGDDGDGDDGTGVQYDIVTSADTGRSIAFLPLDEGGASFELYAYGSAWDDKLYFLDRKVIGHYMPEASITIQTEDRAHEWFNPNNPPRTRADKPYTLAISVSGLLSGPEVPEYTREVLYSHLGQNYDETYTPNANPEYVITSFHMGNQQPSFTPVYTRLTPMAPTKAMGIETFTLSTKPDATVPVSSILDEEMLIVWPVSEAIIEGFEDGMQIRDNLPNIMVRYQDLYPLSMTYIQIYPGPAELGTVGQVFGSSMRWHNTTVPQNEVISIENWEDMIPDEGEYTIEVLTITPFDNWAPERLAHVTIKVNRKVTINGQVVTSEK